MNWQQIETAPKDGTRFLAISKYGLTAVCVWYNNKMVVSWDYSDFEIGTCVATHWMPLPEPPK